MSGIAIGFILFKRVQKTERLLNSINPSNVSTVYVADVGKKTDEKRELYSRDYRFDLCVLDLEYDAGLGAGRQRIVDTLDEEFLLILDNDMEVPENVLSLRKQLRQRPDLGGVCGLLIEDCRIYSACSDLFEEGTTISKDIRGHKSVKSTANLPLVEFDFITNAALFRKECLEDYSWDPAYRIGREHIDFFVGHMKRTDWNFALSPTVQFYHYPGGSESYLNDRFREDVYRDAEEYFLEKWGYEKFEKSHPNWLETYDPKFDGFRPHSTSAKIRTAYREGGVRSVFSKGMNYINRLGK